MNSLKYFPLKLIQGVKCPWCGAPNALMAFPVIKSISSPAIALVDGHPEKIRELEDRTLGQVFDFYQPGEWMSFVCNGCHRVCFGTDERNLLFPIRHGIRPAENMPDDIQKIFKESQAILYLSPRASCALLRVCLEKIADHVAELQGIDGYDKKARLVAKIKALNLPPHLQRMCDACRHGGNETAHAGEIDLSDSETADMAEALSVIVNTLVAVLITPVVISEEVLKKLGKG